MTEELKVPERLAAAAHELSERVQELGSQLEIADGQVKRVQYLTRIAVGLAIASALGMILSIFLFIQVHNTAESIKDTQVINCQNANKTRESQTALWDYILLVSSNNPDQTQEQKDFIKELQLWIHTIFAQRDCSDLDREYPIPDPPEVPKS